MITGSVKERLNRITEAIIDSALAVHRELGPGLLESCYEECLTFVLLERGIAVERHKPLPLTFHGHTIGSAYRIDLLVENEVIIEIKSIDRFERVRSAQLLTYLRLADRRVGLLLNFNVKLLMRDGFKRLVYNFPE
jgi:GxxExxY protein